MPADDGGSAEHLFGSDMERTRMSSSETPWTGV